MVTNPDGGLGGFVGKDGEGSTALPRYYISAQPRYSKGLALSSMSRENVRVLLPGMMLPSPSKRTGRAKCGTLRKSQLAEQVFDEHLHWNVMMPEDIEVAVGFAACFAVVLAPLLHFYPIITG